MSFTIGGLSGSQQVVGRNGQRATNYVNPVLNAPTTWDRRRYIHFYGQAFSNAQDNHAFDVLSGDQPPTIVGGYAQWAQVARPLRTGLIVYTGREPMSMQVSVRFILLDQSGSWRTGVDAGTALEEQITTLEWMAGFGAQVGPSPLVYLSTYSAAGKTVPLIPFGYQPDTPDVPKFFLGGDSAPWVVTGLTWDPAPVRNENGFRVRQDATVTLTWYESPKGAPKIGLPRAKDKTVISRPGADTPLKIARTFPSQNAITLAQGIMGASQNKKLKLRSPTQTIKHGKHVVVPSFG